MIGVKFYRSKVVLIGGLFTVGLYTLIAIAHGAVKPDDLGPGMATSWLATVGFALIWLVLMFVYSPLADSLASRLIEKPPNLESFRMIQESRVKLIAGIVVAWVLGGILEELVFRGIVLKSVESMLNVWLGEPVASGIAVCIAASGAGLIHLYQGPRAMIIITQLSILFGILFVVSGYNLWAVMLCHGLYDTIAFVRFANKKSKY